MFSKTSPGARLLHFIELFNAASCYGIRYINREIS